MNQVSSTPVAYPGASLDQSIDIAAMQLSTVKSQDDRRRAWNLLQALVKLRSLDKEKVKEMELARGIHR